MTRSGVVDIPGVMPGTIPGIIPGIIPGVIPGMVPRINPGTINPGMLRGCMPTLRMANRRTE
jgi:spore germination protein Q